jgi:preprotein translocase subunit SecA
MAGRGVDIKLGGDEEQEREKVVELGGLYVIGTNRHESLRVDHQLRGRAGRQGDPGASRFFISLEDDLIERYGIRKNLPKRFRSLKQENAIEHPLVHKEIARGQRIIEGQNFEVRQKIWKYSSFVEEQREMIQSLRRRILLDGARPVALAERAPERYGRLESLVGKDGAKDVEKQISLFQLDRIWKEYLPVIADVRAGIHLASIGGRSPLDEFHRVASAEFSRLREELGAAIVETFQSLPMSDKGMDMENEGIKGPSSTWTYLVSDNQFGLWVGLLHGSAIGSASVAAAVYGPLYIAMALAQRFWRKKG